MNENARIALSLAAALAVPGVNLALAPSTDLAVSLSVEGAVPVRDRDRGPLNPARAKRACGAAAGASGEPALVAAGIAGTSLDLRVGLTRCDSDTIEEPATCLWRLAAVDDPPCHDEFPPAEGRATWHGPEGDVTLSLPDRIGTYRLTLSCAVGDAPASSGPPLEARLHVLFGPPLPTVAPPDPSWLERATEWGCGFGRDSDEREILEQLLEKLYAFGSENWRYGSFEPPTSSAFEAYDEGTKNNPWFSCPWQALAARDDCNFADCYEYSQVFEHVAATLGIGVFEPISNLGQNAQGLVTRLGGRSLDPRFTGNIECTGGCAVAYVFSSHSLRRRDGKVYDATFRSVYGAPDDLIENSVADWDHGHIVLTGTDDRLVGGDRGYGDWSYWLMTEVHTGEGAGVDGSGDPVGGASISQPTLTPDKGRVLVGLRVSVAASGEFSVLAALVPSDPKLPPVLPAHRGSSNIPIPRIEGPGESEVEVSFDTARMFQDPAVKYHLRVAVRPGRGLSPPLAKASFPMDIPASDRGSKPETRFVGVRLAKERGEAKAGLTVTYELAVVEAGDYLVLARLGKEGRTYGYASAKRRFEAGEVSVDLTFPVSGPPPDWRVSLTAELFRIRDTYWYEDSIDFMGVWPELRGEASRP